MSKFYTFFNTPKAHLEGGFDPVITRQEGYRKTEAIINDFIRAGQVLTASQTGNFDLLEGEDTEDFEAPIWRSRRFDEIDLQDFIEVRKAEQKEAQRQADKKKPIVVKSEINRTIHTVNQASGQLDPGKPVTKEE